MVAASKLLREGLAHRSCCNDLVHSDRCLVNIMRISYQFLFSNMKYFAPVCLLSLLVKINKLNKGTVQDALRYYAETSLLGTAVGITTATFICLNRHLFGQFHEATLAFLPSAIGVTPAIFGPSRTRDLFQTSLFQCLIETFLVRRKHRLAIILGDSKLLKTLIFMLSSAVILHAKQLGLYRGFWLLKPNAPASAIGDASKDPRRRTCSHAKSSCVQYLLKGLKGYFIVGLTLDLIKMMMNKIPAGIDGFGMKLLIKLSTFKLMSTTFLTTCIFIYRTAHCLLNRQANLQPDIAHLTAGFLSGLSYIFYPKLPLLTFSIVLALQILLDYFLATDKIDKDRKIRRVLERVPLRNLIFAFGMGHLVHAYIFRRHYVSQLGQAMINGVTNDYAKHLSYNIEKTEKLMEAQMNCVK